MSNLGDHTWEIHVEYHLCPECSNIIENRMNYSYFLGKYQKEVVCNRCGHHFMVVKQGKPAFGPLLGDPQPPEIEWGDPIKQDKLLVK